MTSWGRGVEVILVEAPFATRSTPSQDTFAGLSRSGRLVVETLLMHSITYSNYS